MDFERSFTPAGLAVLIAGAVALSAGNADAGGRGQPHQLVGAWRVALAPYVCATGAPVPVPAVISYVTFGEGGTLVEASANPRFAPGQRTAGHGRWERSGHNEYEAVLEAFLVFDSPPPEARYKKGVQRIEQKIGLVDGERWTATATVEFFDETGALVPPSGCATATAERLR